MARLLVKKQDKRHIPELGREVVVGKAGRYYVSDPSKGFSTLYGEISAKDLALADGSVVMSSTGKRFTILSPSFIDEYKRLKRLPQTIPLKDIGIIIAECGIGHDSVAVDAGCGSGALACMLARICKTVTTYEIEDEHLAVAEHNKNRLGLANLTIKKGDFTKGVAENGADLVTLDLPAPWDAIDAAKACLKIGGFVISYSPSMAQTMDLAQALADRDDFLVIKTIEILEREWEIDGRKVRPKNKVMIHSGFLTFARRIR